MFNFANIFLGKNIDVEKLKKRGLVRRSGTGTLEKARVRTLKMTIVIGKYPSVKYYQCN